jgi:ParB-like chromosome segregation protein Spo0J
VKLEIMQMPLTMIQVGKYKNRPTDLGYVDKLSANIQRIGVLVEPVSITFCDNSWHLVDGHHRLLAIQMLGWTSVMVTIIRRKPDYLSELCQTTLAETTPTTVSETT